MSITPEQDAQEVTNLFQVENVWYEVNLDVSPNGSTRADLFELDSDGSSPSESAVTVHGDSMSGALRALADVLDTWNHVRTV